MTLLFVDADSQGFAQPPKFRHYGRPSRLGTRIEAPVRVHGCMNTRKPLPESFPGIHEHPRLRPRRRTLAL